MGSAGQGAGMDRCSSGGGGGGGGWWRGRVVFLSSPVKQEASVCPQVGVGVCPEEV